MKTILSILLAFITSITTFAYDFEANGNTPEDVMNKVCAHADTCGYAIVDLYNGLVLFTIPNHPEYNLRIDEYKDGYITFIRCDFSYKLIVSCTDFRLHQLLNNYYEFVRNTTKVR